MPALVSAWASAQTQVPNGTVGRGAGIFASLLLLHEALTSLELAVEAVHLTFAVNDALLLTCEERMALRANFGADHFLGRASRPGVAACANDLRVWVKCWVNTLFHNQLPF
jgi:hypothetical protein